MSIGTVDDNVGAHFVCMMPMAVYIRKIDKRLRNDWISIDIAR